MLLDEHGHAHLTDFNIAVYYHPSKPLMSIAGSMAYMAPEVLLRKGYFESVDWWSLGVVMFELLFGRVRWIMIREMKRITSLQGNCINWPQPHLTS